MNMSKKILDFPCDLLILFGILFAIRFIYTKEIYIQAYGYTINTLALLIQTIVVVGLYRSMDKKTNEMIRSNKS